MKTWNFKVNRNPEEVGKTLESALKPIKRFVFNMHYNNNGSITFKVRKRIEYAWYMIYHNYIIVNGQLSKSAFEKETDVKISFSQHFLMNLIILTHLLIGLGFIISIATGINNSPGMYLFGGLLIAMGVVLWFGLKMLFKRKVKAYKTLISDILEF